MVEFVKELSKPTSQIAERSGVPASTANAELINSAGKATVATVNVFSSIAEGDKQTALSNFKEELTKEAIDPLMEAYNSPEMKSLANSAKAQQQGRISSGALAVKSQVLLKQARALRPEISNELDKVANEVLGFAPSQKLVQNALEPEETQKALRKQMLSSSVSNGIAVLKDGQIDEDATISRFQAHAYNVQRAAQIDREYEEGKKTQQQYDDVQSRNVVSDIHDSLDMNFNNFLNSQTYKDISTMPAERQDAAVQNAFNGFQAQFKIKTDEQLARMKFSPDKLKEVQSQRDSFIQSFGEVIIPKVSNVKEYNDMSQMMKSKAEVKAWQLNPRAMMATVVYGEGATDLVASALKMDTTFQASLLNEAKNVFNNPTDKALGSMDFLIDVGSDPSALQRARPAEQTVRTTQTIQATRALASKSNSLPPEQDKTFNILHQNLTNTALAIDSNNTKDIFNAIDEVTSYTNVAALKNSIAKQYNTELVNKSIDNTVGLVEKGLSIMPRIFSEEIANKNLVTVSPSGILTMPTPSESLSSYSSDSIAKASIDRDRAKQRKALVDRYNNMVDTYIQFKDYTPYAGTPDNVIRDKFNAMVLGKGGGQSAADAPTATTGGVSVDNGSMTQAEMQAEIRKRGLIKGAPVMYNLVENTVTLDDGSVVPMDSIKDSPVQASKLKEDIMNVLKKHVNAQSK